MINETDSRNESVAERDLEVDVNAVGTWNQEIRPGRDAHLTWYIYNGCQVNKRKCCIVTTVVILIAVFVTSIYYLYEATKWKYEPSGEPLWWGFNYGIDWWAKIQMPFPL